MWFLNLQHDFNALIVLHIFWQFCWVLSIFHNDNINTCILIVSFHFPIMFEISTCIIHDRYEVVCCGVEYLYSDIPIYTNATPSQVSGVTVLRCWSPCGGMLVYPVAGGRGTPHESSTVSRLHIEAWALQSIHNVSLWIGHEWINS